MGGDFCGKLRGGPSDDGKRASSAIEVEIQASATPGGGLGGIAAGSLCAVMRMTESAHQARLKLFRAPAPPWKGVWGKPFEHRSRDFKLDSTPKGGHLPLPVVDLYPPFFVFP